MAVPCAVCDFLKPGRFRVTDKEVFRHGVWAYIVVIQARAGLTNHVVGRTGRLYVFD